MLIQLHFILEKLLHVHLLLTQNQHFVFEPEVKNFPNCLTFNPLYFLCMLS